MHSSGFQEWPYYFNLNYIFRRCCNYLPSFRCSFTSIFSPYGWSRATDGRFTLPHVQNTDCPGWGSSRWSSVPPGSATTVPHITAQPAYSAYSVATTTCGYHGPQVHIMKAVRHTETWAPTRRQTVRCNAHNKNTTVVCFPVRIIRDYLRKNLRVQSPATARSNYVKPRHVSG
jgi:hypothetical protein